MEIYLDANATTSVLPQARVAALHAMADGFGNPSSVHGSGLRARALLDRVRAMARRVLGAPTGQLLFTSGATEGIQTAVLSALVALRRRRTADNAVPLALLYGATEHKAVPEALKHWSAVLGLQLPIRTIPVGTDGRHDLAWLKQQAPQAGLVCTMAVNNETGVISDLDGIAAALADSRALWLVDGVQALGKLGLRLIERRIDYAPFSGHKLHAPKGIGLLYVREGAPFTPLLAGGGQEGSLRAGTENMAGIAAFGAVLDALEQGALFTDSATLAGYRARLEAALREAFPGLVFNAPAELCLPTTLNFAVPGVGSKVLLNLFDAAELRVSGGSACSAAKAETSPVLKAMNLPAWQAAEAVRMSFGATDGTLLIDEACARIKACGESLRERGSNETRPGQTDDDTVAHDGNVRPELDAASVETLLQAHPDLLLVDVREPYEQRLGGAPALGARVRRRALALSSLQDALPAWLAVPSEGPVLFFCRSGNRSAQAAKVLRRLGHPDAWSLAGGLASWPCESEAPAPTP